MLGVEIPDGYLFSVLPVAITFLVGLLAWIVREMGKQQMICAAMTERINAQHESLIAQNQTLVAQAATLTAQAVVLAGQEVRLTALEAR